MISCIIPCYGSENSIAAVVDEIKRTLEGRAGTEYEIILVNDASPDGVLEVARSICHAESNVKVIDLAKNFGQHNALMAGINHACGDAYVFLDDDGQTPADEIWKLIDALDDDCDVVFAKFANKQHALWRNLGSRINSYMMEVLLGKPKGLYLSAYSAFKGFIADELRRYDGMYSYTWGLLLRSAKKIKNVDVAHREREIGDSGYTIKKLLSLWFNGFTAFSVKPLRIATVMGCVFAIFGFVYGVYIVAFRLLNPDIAVGFTSLMAVLLLIGGMIMVILGLIGEYIGRIYISINNSPQFVVREKIGFDEADGDGEEK